MKIFITGIAGFLGSHLAEYWLSQGASVRGVDNFSGGSKDNIPQNVEYFFCDIATSQFALDFLTSLMEGLDVVYHCAAAPYEGVSVFSPAYISDNIFSGSVNVFTAAIRAGVRRIVNCSSMARYGAIQPPFSEDAIPKPRDPYGIAKLAAEDVLRVLSDVHGIEYTIAVPHNIYGPRQKYDDPYRNVAAIMANRMLQGKPPIIYGDGEQRRCFSYVDDCISCLAAMATQDNVVGEVINIGPDKEDISINTLAHILNLIIQKDLPHFNPIYMPDRPQEVKIAHCSSDKARDLLGYETKTGIVTGMQKLVDYIWEKGPKPFQYDHVPIEILNDKTPRTWSEKLM